MRETALQAARWHGPHSLGHNFIMNFHFSPIWMHVYNIEVSHVELWLAIIISYFDSSWLKTSNHSFSMQTNEA